MVLALKLISAGVSYQDGLKKPEVPFLAQRGLLQPLPAHCPVVAFFRRTRLSMPVDVHYRQALAGDPYAQEMSPYQQAHVVRQLPSLLEWMSFIFAGGNLLAGPYFELSDYLAYIERRGPWDPKVTRQPSLAAQYEAGVRNPTPLCRNPLATNKLMGWPAWPSTSLDMPTPNVGAPKLKNL